MTTSRIAAEAGISVGALYRFFPDKQSIIDAIAVKRVEQFQALLQAKLSVVEAMEPPQFLEFVLDEYIGFLDEHPDFRTISVGRHISAATHERHARPDIGPAAVVRKYIIDALGIEVPAELDRKLQVMTEAGERLIAFAYEQPTAGERAAVIVELKLLLGRYLFG